jgi:hypothetical protein
VWFEFAGFEILTPVILLAAYSLLIPLALLLDPGDGSSRVLQNVGVLLSHNMAWHTIR